MTRSMASSIAVAFAAFFLSLYLVAASRSRFLLFTFTRSSPRSSILGLPPRRPEIWCSSLWRSTSCLRARVSPSVSLLKRPPVRLVYTAGSSLTESESLSAILRNLNLAFSSRKRSLKLRVSARRTSDASLGVAPIPHERDLAEQSISV